MKEVKAAELAAGADGKSSGRFVALRLTKRAGGLDTLWCSGSDATSRKNKQRGCVLLEASREKSAM